jgi:hypothetical protein
LRILVEWKEGVTALEAALLEVMGDIPIVRNCADILSGCHLGGLWVMILNLV